MIARAYKNTENKLPYLKHSLDSQAYIKAHWEGEEENAELTSSYSIRKEIQAKTILNKINKTETPFHYAISPYQKSEIEKNRGQDINNTTQIFEPKSTLEILIKVNASELLENTFQNKNWQAEPIQLTGDIDCYHNIERHYKITRRILELCLKYKHPIQIITKNSLIERDLDLLKALNNQNLVQVCICISTLDEDMRQLLDADSSSSKRKLETIVLLASHQIPVYTEMTPVIPSLNSHEILEISKLSSLAGSKGFTYKILDLNKSKRVLFIEWVKQTFPKRAEKIIQGLKECQENNTSKKGLSISHNGHGQTFETIQRIVNMAKQKYYPFIDKFKFNCTAFIHNNKGQLNLF